nr:hypothetical protein [Tanacetum cinerariifolium]
MATTIDQQVALDKSLVPSMQRLRIGRSNFRLPSDIQSKESTLQVVYDVLRSSPLFRAFQVTADVPEIYMQEFWAMAKLHHNSIRFKIDTKKSELWATTYVHQHFIRFKMDSKKNIVDLETFKDMLHISPRVLGQSFDGLPFEEEILDFIRFLGHSAQIKSLTDNSPFFRAFQVTADVPEIYMQEFWATAKLHHNSIHFKIDTKKSVLDLEAFREMLNISPRIPSQSFAELPSEEEILEFLRIEESVNATLEAEVLTRASHSSRTSYVVAADLLEMELKKILIKKMEGNKSIQRSDEQRNLYKALVEAYDVDKTILDTYGELTILKRRREDDDQEGPFAGSDRGSKRRRERGEHASASTSSEIATRSAGRSTTGSQSRQLSANEFAFTEEPVQTTCQMKEPSHPVFEIGTEDQPIVYTSQHPEWFSQPRRPPTPDRDWNKICQLLKEMLSDR